MDDVWLGDMLVNVLITGASGLVGTALVDFLNVQDHRCQTLSRQAGAPLCWDLDTQTIQLGENPRFDAVIHLAGESIAQGRWTVAKKARIRDSRIQGTRLLAETLARLDHKPEVLVSASAIGYYGDRGVEKLDESSHVGRGYLSEVCQAWEAATRAAQEAGIRVVQARLGVVLSAQGGALQSMLLPFKLGLGGRVGSGQQYMSWVALTDVVTILSYLITETALSGPVNIVAPQPVTNREFTHALGDALHRLTLFPMPAFVARLVFGELADALLLASTRVVPTKLIDTGFEFQFSEIGPALDTILALGGQQHRVPTS